MEPAEAQTAPADAPKANKRGHEARDAQDSRNKRVEQEQAPEPQPLNLEATLARYKQLRLTQLGADHTLVRMRERGLNEENEAFAEEFHRLRDFVARDFLGQP